MRTLGSARLTIAASVPFAINQWSKKTARRSDTVDDGKQLPFLLHDQRKDAVINTPLTANWMALKCLKLKNHVLETWMLEHMSDIESNLSIAMHLHVHNGEIMDETRLLLTGPHARWMTSDGVKLCDVGTHDILASPMTGIQFVSTALLFHAADKCWYCFAWSAWRRLHNCVDDVAAMFPLIEVCSGLTDAVVRILQVRTHMCTIPVGWPCMYMHHDWCHTFQACKWYSVILCNLLI